MRKMSNLDFRPLYMYTHMYTRKKRGRREGGTNRQTDVQMDGKRKRDRELHAKLEERDRGSEAGGASDFFFFKKKDTFESYWTLYKTDFRTGRKQNKTKIMLQYFSRAEQEVRRRARDWRG